MHSVKATDHIIHKLAHVSRNPKVLGRLFEGGRRVGIESVLENLLSNPYFKGEIAYETYKNSGYKRVLFDYIDPEYQALESIKNPEELKPERMYRDLGERDFYQYLTEEDIEFITKKQWKDIMRHLAKLTGNKELIKKMWCDKATMERVREDIVLNNSLDLDKALELFKDIQVKRKGETIEKRELKDEDLIWGIFKYKWLIGRIVKEEKAKEVISWGNLDPLRILAMYGNLDLEGFRTLARKRDPVITTSLCYNSKYIKALKKDPELKKDLLGTKMTYKTATVYMTLFGKKMMNWTLEQCYEIARPYLLHNTDYSYMPMSRNITELSKLVKVISQRGIPLREGVLRSDLLGLYKKVTSQTQKEREIKGELHQFEAHRKRIRTNRSSIISRDMEMYKNLKFYFECIETNSELELQ